MNKQSYFLIKSFIFEQLKLVYEYMRLEIKLLLDHNAMTVLMSSVGVGLQLYGGRERVKKEELAVTSGHKYDSTLHKTCQILFSGYEKYTDDRDVNNNQ